MVWSSRIEMGLTIHHPYKIFSSPAGAPLDHVTAVGQFYMYSVRLLRSDYLGPLFRVRRDSDDLEQDMFPDPVSKRVEASQLTDFRTGPGDILYPVAFYNQYSLSSIPRDIFQINILRQPTMNPSILTPNGFVTWQRETTGNEGYLQTDIINNQKARKCFGFVYVAVDQYGGDRSIIEATPGGWSLRTHDNGANNWVYEVQWDAQEIQSDLLPYPPPVPAPYEALGHGMSNTAARGYRNGASEGIIQIGSHDLGIHTQKWGDNSKAGAIGFSSCEMVFGADHTELEMMTEAQWKNFQINQRSTFGVV